MEYFHPNVILEGHLKIIGELLYYVLANVHTCPIVQVLTDTDIVFRMYWTSLCIQLEEVMANKRNSSIHSYLGGGWTV